MSLARFVGCVPRTKTLMPHACWVPNLSLDIYTSDVLEGIERTKLYHTHKERKYLCISLSFHHARPRTPTSDRWSLFRSNNRHRPNPRRCRQTGRELREGCIEGIGNGSEEVHCWEKSVGKCDYGFRGTKKQISSRGKKPKQNKTRQRTTHVHF